MELFERNACDLSEMIKNKEISSAELTKSVFDRIKTVEDKVDAYLTLDEENAMKKAAEIDEKLANGEELSPLAGIPVGIKDNISTKGLRTTCASKMLGNYVPPFNATVMNKLDDIVITGKLNMDEFAMGSSTENSHFKPTKNPFDTERIPGGSSGGSAAAGVLLQGLHLHAGGGDAVRPAVSDPAEPAVGAWLFLRGGGRFRLRAADDPGADHPAAGGKCHPAWGRGG